MNRKELFNLHDCGDDMMKVMPYLKLSKDNDVYCGNCNKKLYDSKTDKIEVGKLEDLEISNSITENWRENWK